MDECKPLPAATAGSTTSQKSTEILRPWLRARRRVMLACPEPAPNTWQRSLTLVPSRFAHITVHLLNRLQGAAREGGQAIKAKGVIEYPKP